MLYSFLFKLYFILLVFGPIAYLGGIPFTLYQGVYFILVIFLGLTILGTKQKLTMPFYMKVYTLTLVFYVILYPIKLFTPSYLPSIRDYIVIFSSLQFTLLVALVFDVSKYKEMSKDLLRCNTYMMAVVGVVAICQMFNLLGVPEFLANYYSNLNPEQRLEYLRLNPRATGTFNFEPNTLGLYSSFSLLIFHMFIKELRFSSWKAIIIYLLGLLGLLLSGSMTGILIYFITTLIYFVVYKKIGIKFTLVVVVLFMLLLNTFSDEIDRTLTRQKITADSIIPSSLKHRLNDRWLMVYDDFEEHYLVGIGPAAMQLTYATDNEYLDRFLRYGVFGGVVFFAFIVFLIIYPLYKRKNITDGYLRKLFLLSSLIALVFALASLTGTAFKAKRVSELFWIFYSLAFIYSYLAEHKKIKLDEK